MEANLSCPREIDAVGDHEQIVVVVLDFRQAAGRDAVLDGQRVEMKKGFQHRFDFLVGGIFQVDPNDETLVGLNEAKSFRFQIAAGDFTFAENEGMNHGWGTGPPGSFEPAKARSRNCALVGLPDWAAGYLVSGPRILFSSSLTVAMKASGVGAANSASR